MNHKSNTKTDCQTLADRLNADPEMKSCFDSLPQMVKENLMMSGADIENVQQLRSSADKLIGRI